MVWAVILAIMSLLFWVLGAILLRGLNKCIINGYTKADGEKFIDQYDAIAMNRYISKTMLFPFAAILSFSAIMLFFDIPFMRSSVFGVIFAIAVFAVVGFSFYSVTQILGDRFKKGRE